MNGKQRSQDINSLIINFANTKMATIKRPSATTSIFVCSPTSIIIIGNNGDPLLLNCVKEITENRQSTYSLKAVIGSGVNSGEIKEFNDSLSNVNRNLIIGVGNC